MSDYGYDTEETRYVPDFKSELAAFNEMRRAMLGGKPIHPEGEEALMPEEPR